MESSSLLFWAAGLSPTESHSHVYLSNFESACLEILIRHTNNDRSDCCSFAAQLPHCDIDMEPSVAVVDPPNSSRHPSSNDVFGAKLLSVRRLLAQNVLDMIKRVEACEEHVTKLLEIR